MIALTLEIAAVAFFLMAAAVVYVFRQAARAPMGFENPDGFHFGTEPATQSAPSKGNAHRRKRVVVPAVVTADDHTMSVQIHHVPPAQPAH